MGAVKFTRPNTKGLLKEVNKQYEDFLQTDVAQALADNTPVFIGSTLASWDISHTGQFEDTELGDRSRLGQLPGGEFLRGRAEGALFSKLQSRTYDIRKTVFIGNSYLDGHENNSVEAMDSGLSPYNPNVGRVGQGMIARTEEDLHSEFGKISNRLNSIFEKIRR